MTYLSWLRRASHGCTVLGCTVTTLLVLTQTVLPAANAETVVVGEFPEAYPIHMPLTVQGDGPWYRLPLPLAIRWQAAHPDLRDLRVFNAEGESLAYGFVSPGARQHREVQTQAVKWFPLRGPVESSGKQPGIRVQRSSDGTLIQVMPESGEAEQGVVEQGTSGQGAQVGQSRTSQTPAQTTSSQLASSPKTIVRGWLLDTSAISAPLQKLALDWQGGAEGFQRFRIEASDDLQQWRSWGDGQIARLAFEGERIERREIDLPGTRARYLRLTWESPREAPTLTQAVLTSTTSNDVLPPLDWSDPIQAKRDGDEYQVSLPKSTVLERVRVSLYQPNMLAPVSLSMRNTAYVGSPGPSIVNRRDTRREPSWDRATSSVLYRLMQDGTEIRQDELDLPAMPISDLKLKVDPRGGGLGDAVSFRVAARAMEMVFLARGTPPYTLAMGRDIAQPTQLPLAVLVPGYQPDRLVTMGTARAAVPAAAATSARPSTEATTNWKKIGLWAVLLAGVGLLGLMAASLLKGQRSPQEPR